MSYRTPYLQHLVNCYLKLLTVIESLFLLHYNTELSLMKDQQLKSLNNIANISN